MRLLTESSTVILASVVVDISAMEFLAVFVDLMESDVVEGAFCGFDIVEGEVNPFTASVVDNEVDA